MDQIESGKFLHGFKFVLLTTQVLLLVVTLGNAKYHVYQELGEELSTSDPLYQEESKQFVGLVITWMCFCGFEFLMMLVGSSIPHMFA